ncbi:fatty acid CoA ligase Acsl3-like isoform X1 [Haliotis rufescens]|uniref:fatty acid CoA ligase Acsl3-like isoform X1 n=1 Tax=Haliotis rufescens TaxID=6454 RepID=UPI00201F8F22|nr:fatty acid CoA ligase Acsl3-like isoform X1 [Haliotis rufescens]XP_048247394.1 fatty acid CoA ligase Acsl3-like isoform X1 [Haliotis rufescens]
MSDVFIQAVFGLIKAVVFVYDVVAYIPYIITYRPQATLKRSSRIKATPVDGSYGSPYRYADNPKLTTTLFPECSTLDHLFLRAVQQYTDRPCLGTRELLREEDEVQPNGRVFKKVLLGEYNWLTYAQVFERATNFGSGVLACSQRPRRNIVIFADTRAEWIVAAQACFKYNFPVVTLYATLGQDAIVHGITETEVTHVITSDSLVSKFEGLMDRIPLVTHLIVMTGGKKLPAVKNIPSRVKLLSMTDVEYMGAQPENLQTPVTHPCREDIAVIMYTSGSTGLPKGVLISHGNLMSGMSGQCERIPNLGPPDIYIGYLPLAHVLELSAELSCVSHGVCIGYSSPLTLTDQSSKIKRGSKGDVSVLQPTLMAAVPVIMDRIYKGVWDKVNGGGKFGQALFSFAYEYKRKQLENGYDTPLLNKLVFSKICKLLGGNVRLMLCGGAPLSDATQRFMNICFCCPVGQGYGLTETCGAGTVTEVTDLSTGRVGAPLQCSEIRLRDWPEGNYTSADKPCPRGEILVGGGNVSMGYYKNAEKTKEDFTEIGGIRYFCTGDIGQFDGDGCLKIIDRKKDLVKLQAGEYVSLSKVETAVKVSPLVDQICVCADSLYNYTVALVVPNQKNLTKLAQELGINGVEFNQLCQNTSLVKEVLKRLSVLSAKSKLEKFEIPQKIKLCPEGWTPEAGLVTDAFKLKRRNIEAHFKADIRSMYS